ncbi:MAG: polysulfide reductase NrfD [Acidobacteria bacterium]|nr:polysulfide reductase NrfD [Acidobacteriota bacterium]
MGAFGARPLWNSPMLGPLFLASGLSGAAALLMLLEPDEGLRHGLAKLDARFLGAEALVLALLFAVLSTGGASQRSAALLFFGGQFTAVFWIGVMFLGMLMPWLLERWQRAGWAQNSVVPPVLVLFGGAALRAVIVLAGQASHWEVSF